MTTLNPELDSIYNFLKLTERISTGGQPTEEQFKVISASGFEVVINLALSTSDSALADEGQIVVKSGMIYEHIPVIWEAPTQNDLARFLQVMSMYEHKKLFVHCAANMRVSAFMAIYRVLVLKWNYQDTLIDLHKIWQPNSIWQLWIEQALNQ